MVDVHTDRVSRKELVGSSPWWGPRLSQGKWGTGGSEDVGFELGLERCSRQEGNEIHPWLMENGGHPPSVQCSVEKCPPVGRRERFSELTQGPEQSCRKWLKRNVLVLPEDHMALPWVSFKSYQGLRKHFMMMDSYIFRTFF